MSSAESGKAVAAAMSTASGLGMEVDDAVVLNDSNRFVIRLLPCDTVARVTPVTHHAGHQVSPEREVDVARQLAETDSPIAGLDVRVEPRIIEQDGFKIAFWIFCDGEQSLPIPPTDYAKALERLHAGLRHIAVDTPHAMDRVAAVQADVTSQAMTPDLSTDDRDFLSSMLRDLRSAITTRQAAEQLLHGEPHSGNLLSAPAGLLFIDFENTCHGPVEYDLGWVPREVSDRYVSADQDLVGLCRGLVLAMVAAYRWRHDDQHPSGRQSGIAFLNVLKGGPPWPALDDVTW